MLYVLIIIAAVLSGIKIIRGVVEDKLPTFIGGVIGTTFYTLAAVFGGFWQIAIGVIFGIAANAASWGDNEMSEKHPMLYCINFVMMVLFIIAILITVN